jgi:hypothetical protein
MGGKGDDDYEKDTKIIKKIAKVVGIEKSWDEYYFAKAKIKLYSYIL